jgi:Domain of unknown function (DUF4136)
MKAKIVVSALTIWLVSAMAMAQEVSVNYVHGKSFAQYHTYAWGGNNQNQVANSILAQEAQQDINAALQAKGLQMVQENQNPDLIVTAGGGARQETSYSAWGTRGIGGGMGEITPQQNVEGTLIVNLYDTKSKSLVWRGIAENTLQKSGEKNQKTVAKAIEKMFKKWPQQ